MSANSRSGIHIQPGGRVTLEGIPMTGLFQLAFTTFQFLDITGIGGRGHSNFGSLQPTYPQA